MSALGRALAPHGINLVGAATVESYDAGVPPLHALRRLVPGARTAIVLGNGGAAFWSAYRAFCRRRPGHEARADPLDDFTIEAVENAARPVVGERARFLYPFRFPAEPVSFMRLAECAGVARPSLLGVLVHPVYGPWIAFRAAIMVPMEVEAPCPAEGFDPCPGCIERACVSGCPAGAVSRDGWDVPRCAAHRFQEEDGCAARCHARFECVIGREHRYPAEALAYHQARARASLAAFVPRRLSG